jgi:hypothetical protein
MGGGAPLGCAFGVLQAFKKAKATTTSNGAMSSTQQLGRNNRDVYTRFQKW